MTYHAHINFPYLDNFSQLVQRLYEYGFAKHFEEITNYKLNFNDNYRKDVDNTNQEVAIKLVEIATPCIIFMIGMGISIVVFILEIIFARYETKILKLITRRKN